MIKPDADTTTYQIDEIDFDTLTFHFEWEGKRRVENFRDDKTILGISVTQEGTENSEEIAVAALNSGESIPCWINPDEPQEFTLDKKTPHLISFFLGIFTLSHGLAGICLIYYTLAERNSRRQDDSYFRANDLRWAFAIALLFWSIAFWWTSILIFQEPNADSTKRLIAAGVSLIGILPIWLFLRQCRYQSWNRTVEIELPSEGIILGNQNRILIKSKIPGTSISEAIASSRSWKITCVEKIDDDSENQIPDEELWSETKEAICVSPSEFALDFTLPYDGEFSQDEENETRKIAWELSAGKVRGVKIGPFILPVHQRIAEPRSVEVDSPNVSAIDFLETESIDQSFDGTHFTYHFGPNRHPMATTGTAIFGIVFITIAAFIAVEVIGTNLLVIPFVFAGICSLGWNIHARKTKESLRIEDDRFVKTRTSPFISRKSEILFQEIRHFETPLQLSTNNKAFYGVTTTCDEGRTEILASMFKSRASAKAFAEVIRSAAFKDSIQN